MTLIIGCMALRMPNALFLSKASKVRDVGTAVGQGGKKELRAMQAYKKQNKSLPIMLVSVQQRY